MASIEGHDGRWKVRYRSPDGRQRSKTLPTKTLANKFAATVEADLHRGQWTDPQLGRRTFGEVAGEWQLAQVHDESTAALVDGTLRRHLLPTFGYRPLAAIRPSEVQAWVKLKSTELAPSTLRVTYRWLAAVFNAAVLDGAIPRTPCRGIRLPPVEKEQVHPLAVEEVAAIADAVPDRYRAMVVLAAGTGLRQGEVFGVQVGDVDFLRRVVHVRRQVKSLPGRPPFLASPKTPSSIRTVPLPEVVLVELAEHLRRWPAEDGGLVFTTGYGAPYERSTFNAVWRKAVASVGLAGVGFHDLRHHYASVLIRAAESVKVIQARLGHKSALETLDTYGHLWPDSEDSTRAAVDAAWKDVSSLCPAADGSTPLPAVSPLSAQSLKY
jgi:integrase